MSRLMGTTERPPLPGPGANNGDTSGAGQRRIEPASIESLERIAKNLDGIAQKLDTLTGRLTRYPSRKIFYADLSAYAVNTLISLDLRGKPIGSLFCWTANNYDPPNIYAGSYASGVALLDQNFYTYFNVALYPVQEETYAVSFLVESDTYSQGNVFYLAISEELCWAPLVNDIS